MKKLILSGAVALLASTILIPPATANDSSAAVGLGGLVLTRNDAVSMDSEDLFISASEVRVKYRFTNQSGKDVETLVSFPLPDMPAGAFTGGDMAVKDVGEISFETWVNSKPVELKRAEKVLVNGRPDILDAQEYITKQGWPLRYWNDYDFLEKLGSLSDTDKQQYIASGYFVPTFDGGVEPNWAISTHVTRMQNFPAGKTITVEHRYVPVVGGSLAGTLDKDLRTDEYQWPGYAKDYCIDDNFLTGFDRRQKNLEQKGENNFYVIQSLHYILSSGANWKGPIKDFRLVVDKGTAFNFVSFCMDGVTKISPTQFEVRKTNFEPKNDLQIIILEWMSPEDRKLHQ